MPIKPALFEEEGHVYRDPDTKMLVPSVTQVLASCGLTSYNGVRQSVLDYKAQIGTEAHAACSLIAQGVEVDCDPRVTPFVEGYRVFAELKKWKPIVIQPAPAIGEIDGMPCGFQPDEVGMLDGHEALNELKCCSDDHVAHGLQLAAYDMLMGGEPRLRVVTRLIPENTPPFKLKPYKDRSDYTIFKAALAITHWKLNRGLSL
jgi:hypothetical protein